MKDIKSYMRESRNQEVDTMMENILAEIRSEGLKVEFGKIGIRTTYAMIYDENHDTEIVGYTFVKDIKFYKENVGMLKALQQAMARKRLSSIEDN